MMTTDIDFDSAAYTNNQDGSFFHNQIMKQFQINILVNEDELIRAYTEGHDIAESDCPDIEQMLKSELNWLSSSGISFSDQIEPIDHNSYTLNFEILQLASGHYLTAEYPNNWHDLSEDEQLKFVSDNS